MERYPGLFRMKTAGPKGIEKTEGELRLRLSSLEQIEKWRTGFPKSADKWRDVASVKKGGQ
jgi:hypothetical protein